MNEQAKTAEQYREQIRRCAQALALAKNGLVSDFVPRPADLERVAMFTEGNLDKRKWKLEDQLDFLSDVVENVDELFTQFIHEVPLVAYDTGNGDCERFLDWLCKTQPITEEQLDYVTCQKGRLAVESAAARNRLAHLHFQELWPMAAEFASRLHEDRGRLWVHTNPVRVVTAFLTRVLLDDDADVPARVVFFPVGNDIRSAVVEDAAIQILRAVSPGRPRLVSDLIDNDVLDDEATLLETLRDLSEVGLVAFG